MNEGRNEKACALSAALKRSRSKLGCLGWIEVGLS